MSTASQGRYTEHRVARHMTEHGWELIVRAAASKGPADLVMAHETHGGALVQVGRKSKTLGPADRARLLRAAWLLGALPILAICAPRQAPRYFLISDGTPRTWGEWSPSTQTGPESPADGLAGSPEGEGDDYDNASDGSLRVTEPTHIFAKGPVPRDIIECQSEERVMHICSDPDLCESLDHRPPVDLLGGER